MSKGEYRTRQREAILRYLSERPGTHMTVSELQRGLDLQDIHIGMTTIYRTMDRLVSENLVRKYDLGNGKSACFEYLNEETRQHPGEYHLRCEDCGRLIHLHCDHMNAIIDHIQDGHGFSLDPARTVFYGVCAECQQKRGHHESR